MKVFKRPGSSYYAYKFQYRGREYYRSTGTENRREAESIAAAARVRIVRQAAGLEEPEPLQEPFRPKIPANTFRRSASFNPLLTSGSEPPRRSRRAPSSFIGRAIRSFSTTGRGPA
jgi:hypothetical protein